jgi:hypothetical protein
VAHCLGKGKYIQSRTGSSALPDFTNPHLLSWLFPHLDPWGLGGFFEEKRSRSVTLETQLKHMLLMDDQPFAEDSTFAFIFFNLVRKLQNLKTTNFHVRQGQHTSIVGSLMNIDPKELSLLASKFERDPNYKPHGEWEQNTINTLNKLNVIARDLPGSKGYKQCRRNEIRALTNRYGTPALFVTINRSDIHHPLVRVLAGDSDISLEDTHMDLQLSVLQKKLLVAKHPAAAAQFFDHMMCDFFQYVLRYGDKSKPRLFGKCEAYYCMAEAQGKGTLQGHMLIWLEGNLYKIFEIRCRVTLSLNSGCLLGWNPS